MATRQAYQLAGLPDLNPYRDALANAPSQSRAICQDWNVSSALNSSMIFYLVSETHSYTINSYLTSWGIGLASRMRTIYYEELYRMKRVPAGTYIFSDIERLSPQQAEQVAGIWKKLANSGIEARLLNHPTHSMRRYELLRTLYERGFNQFNVYRLTEQRQPQRFPVFIRGENDHGGSRTDLLHTPEELDAAIAQIFDSGQSREDKLIVEYIDTADEQGLFRKYSAFIVGDRILPRHLFFGEKWVLKVPKRVDDPFMVEERAYVENNPHEATLREVFQLARIQYGRIDYSLLDGKPQVWEINTNPQSLGEILPDNEIQVPRLPQTRFFASRFNQAFEAIDSKADPRQQISVAEEPLSVQLSELVQHTIPNQIARTIRQATAPFPRTQQVAQKKFGDIRKDLKKRFNPKKKKGES